MTDCNFFPGIFIALILATIIVIYEKNSDAFLTKSIDKNGLILKILFQK